MRWGWGTFLFSCPSPRAALCWAGKGRWALLMHSDWGARSRGVSALRDGETITIRVGVRNP